MTATGLADRAGVPASVHARNNGNAERLGIHKLVQADTAEGTDISPLGAATKRGQT